MKQFSVDEYVDTEDSPKECTILVDSADEWADLVDYVNLTFVSADRETNRFEEPESYPADVNMFPYYVDMQDIVYVGPRLKAEVQVSIANTYQGEAKPVAEDPEPEAPAPTPTPAAETKPVNVTIVKDEIGPLPESRPEANIVDDSPVVINADAIEDLIETLGKNRLPEWIKTESSIREDMGMPLLLDHEPAKDKFVLRETDREFQLIRKGNNVRLKVTSYQMPTGAKAKGRRERTVLLVELCTSGAEVTLSVTVNGDENTRFNTEDNQVGKRLYWLYSKVNASTGAPSKVKQSLSKMSSGLTDKPLFV